MLEKLISITEELIELLKNEQSLLNERKLSQAGELLERKESLNNDYQLLVLQMKNNLEGLKASSLQSRAQLYLKTTEMKKLLKENERLLEVVTIANDRIIKALVAQFTSKVPVVEAYSRLGTHLKGHIAKTAALAVSAGF